MTPPKLTDEQIWNSDKIMAANSQCGAVFETLRKLVDAAADLRDRQWAEMLAGQEPVGEIGWAADVPNSILEVNWKRRMPPIGTKLYTHPAPDQAAVMRQALEALKNPDGLDAFNRSISDNAIAALEQALGEQP